MRVLVCGGRDYQNQALLNSLLSHHHKHKPFSVLCHGNATGADKLAEAWAMLKGIPTIAFPAEWERYGLAAGHLRNAQMLREFVPELVLAFPTGGPGTADMIQQTKAAGVPLVIFE